MVASPGFCGPLKKHSSRAGDTWQPRTQKAVKRKIARHTPSRMIIDLRRARRYRLAAIVREQGGCRRGFGAEFLALDSGCPAEYGERRRRTGPASQVRSQEVVMVRISVFDATSEGKKFDHDDDVNRHMKLVRERLGSFGLVRTEVDKGMAGGASRRRFRSASS